MIIVVPKGTLSVQQKGAITKKGAMVIECDDPDKVRVINPETSIDNSDWFMASLYALTCNTPTSKSDHFINQLYKRLKNKEVVEATEKTISDPKQSIE
jgi:hypothetical protein